MKKIIVCSVFDAFEYVMDHYYPYGMEDVCAKNDCYAVISIQDSHTKGFGVQFQKNVFCKDVLTLLFEANAALGSLRASSQQYAQNPKLQQIAAILERYPGVMLGAELKRR